MQFGAVTDIGMHRKINEDNYYVNESDTFPYAVVADGMGGHQAGEVASMMVVDIIENHLEKNLDTELDYVEQEKLYVRRLYRRTVSYTIMQRIIIK